MCAARSSRCDKEANRSSQSAQQHLICAIALVERHFAFTNTEICLEPGAYHAASKANNLKSIDEFLVHLKPLPRYSKCNALMSQQSACLHLYPCEYILVIVNMIATAFSPGPSYKLCSARPAPSASSLIRSPKLIHKQGAMPIIDFVRSLLHIILELAPR